MTDEVIEIDEHGKVHGDGLEDALACALNRYSAENPSNTPDWVLAQFLLGCLAAWNQGVQQRETWYGRDPRPSCATPPSLPPPHGDGWQPISDPPPTAGTVLLSEGITVSSGYFRATDRRPEWHDVSRRAFGCEATHWMPLPLPPAALRPSPKTTTAK